MDILQKISLRHESLHNISALFDPRVIRNNGRNQKSKQRKLMNNMMSKFRLTPRMFPQLPNKKYRAGNY